MVEQSFNSSGNHNVVISARFLYAEYAAGTLLIVWSYSEVFVFIHFFVVFAELAEFIMVFILRSGYLSAAYATIVLLFGHILATANLAGLRDSAYWL